ncbi:MAG TPA: polysaccharide biosynthesis/export family protein [Sumerlaeia bacterium]|nr:polysaccharide biosynthesis/export family protein [Sumerlaeia bacterium]
MSFEKTTFSFDQDRAPYTIFREYKMAPGDLLDVLYHVDTWRTSKEDFRIAVDHTVAVKFVNVPTLSEEQMVRPDGTISLPYLGSVTVVGKTVQELTADLRSRYSAILKSPDLYVLVPEYRLRIQEFKQDLHTAPRGLSRLVTVRPDGYATFAMLGDVLVAGRAIPEVAKYMNEEYEKKMPGLSVDLFLEKHAGSLVYVLGEVGRPGAYPIMRYTSVEEAMALAEGPLPTAKLDQVVVVRRHGDKMAAVKLNVKKTLWLDSDGKFFYLLPDDIVYVPRRKFARWADVARDIGDITFFRGWSVGAQYRLDNKGQ